MIVCARLNMEESVQASQKPKPRPKPRVTANMLRTKINPSFANWNKSALNNKMLNEQSSSELPTRSRPPIKPKPQGLSAGVTPKHTLSQTTLSQVNGTTTESIDNCIFNSRPPQGELSPTNLSDSSLAKNRPPLPMPRKIRIGSSPECLENDLEEKSDISSMGITSLTWSETTTQIVSSRLKSVPPTLPKPFSKLDMSSSSQSCVTQNPLKMNSSHFNLQPTSHFSIVEINISNDENNTQCSTSNVNDTAAKSNLVSTIENQNIFESSTLYEHQDNNNVNKKCEINDLQSSSNSTDYKPTKEINCSDITKEKANSFPKFCNSYAGRLRKFSAGSNVAEIAKRFDSTLPSRRNSLVRSFPALPTNWSEDRSKEMVNKENEFKFSIKSILKGNFESDQSSRSDSIGSLLADNLEIGDNCSPIEKAQEKNNCNNKLNTFSQVTQNEHHVTVITIGFNSEDLCENENSRVSEHAKSNNKSDDIVDIQRNESVGELDSHYSVIDESDEGINASVNQKSEWQSQMMTNPVDQDTSSMHYDFVRVKHPLNEDCKSKSTSKRTHRRQRSYSDTAQIIFINQHEMETESKISFGVESDTGCEDDIYNDVIIPNSDTFIKDHSDGKVNLEENAWIDVGNDKKRQMPSGRSSSRRKNYKKRNNNHKRSNRLKTSAKSEHCVVGEDDEDDKTPVEKTQIIGRKSAPSDNSDAWETESDSESTSSFEHIYEMIQEERQPKPPQRTSSLRESKDTSSSPEYGTDSQESGSDQPRGISKAAFRAAQEKKRKMLLSSLSDFPSQIAAKLTKVKPRVNSFGAADVPEQRDSTVPLETNRKDFKKFMKSRFGKNKSTPNLYGKLNDPEPDQISTKGNCDSPMISKHSIPTEANNKLPNISFTPLTTPKLSARHESRQWVDVDDVKKALMNRRKSTPVTSFEALTSIAVCNRDKISNTSEIAVNQVISECEQPPVPPPRVTFHAKDKSRRITTDISSFTFKVHSPQLIRSNVKSAIIGSQEIIVSNRSTALNPPLTSNTNVDHGDNSPLRNPGHIQRLNNLLSKPSLPQSSIPEKINRTMSPPPDLPSRRRSRENSSSPFTESQGDNIQNSEKTPPLKPSQRRPSTGIPTLLAGMSTVCGDELDIVPPPSPKSSATDSGIDAADTTSSAGSTGAEDGASTFSDEKENFISPQASPLRQDKKKKSKLESEPLYQYYNCDVIRRAFEEKSQSVIEQSRNPSKQEATNPKSSLLLLQKSESKGGHRTLWCELPEVRQSGILDIIKPQDRKLQEAMFEVITSEAAYLKSLNILVNNFLMAPEFSFEHSTRCVIERRDKHCLFSNIVAVRDVSERFLADLEARWQESVVISDVCDIVAQHAENDFGVYVKYCANQIYQDRTLKKLKNSNPEFIEALRRLEANPECQSLDMQSFLMLPMQRITRLPLLIDAVFHRLEPGTPKFETAKEAMRILTKIVKECNEGARKMEQMEELCKIEQQLDFREIKKIPLVSASRYLVKKGELIRISPESTIKLPFGKNRPSKHSVYLFLFNDILLITKRKSEENYVIVDYCPRNFIQVESIESPESCTRLPTGVPDGCKHLLLLTMLQNHEQKMVEMVLACNLESDCMRWKEAVTPPSSENPNEKIYEEWDCPQVQAIHLYIPKQPDELGLEESDIVNVFRKVADGWYEGERIRDGEKGWFPANHTVEILSSHVRAKNLRQRYRLLAASESYLQTQKRIKK